MEEGGSSGGRGRGEFVSCAAVVVFIHKTALSDVTVPPPFFDFRNR